jgi:hypothetical protein
MARVARNCSSTSRVGGAGGAGPVGAVGVVEGGRDGGDAQQRLPQDVLEPASGLLPVLQPVLGGDPDGGVERGGQQPREEVVRGVEAAAFGDGLHQRLGRRLEALEELAVQRRMAEDHTHDPPVGGASRVVFEHGVDAGLGERLLRRPRPQPLPQLPVAGEGDGADGGLPAGEVVVVGAGGDARRGGDVLDPHVLRTVPERQVDRGEAQRAPGRLLLALSEVHPGDATRFLRAAQFFIQRKTAGRARSCAPRPSCRDQPRATAVSLAQR